jgi:hypothetical protein
MWQKLALVAAAAIPLVGCAGGSVSTVAQPSVQATAPPVAIQNGQSDVFGAAASEYVLVSVDGHALPYAPSASGDAAIVPTEVISGTLALQTNGAFSIATTYREARIQGARVYDGKGSGACAPDGDGFRMYWEGGGDTGLTVSGDTVSVNNNGVLYRYLKRR